MACGVPKPSSQRGIIPICRRKRVLTPARMTPKTREVDRLERVQTREHRLPPVPRETSAAPATVSVRACLPLQLRQPRSKMDEADLVVNGVLDVHAHCRGNAVASPRRQWSRFAEADQASLSFS